jgi:hypothetical protein
MNLSRGLGVQPVSQPGGFPEGKREAGEVS